MTNQVYDNSNVFCELANGSTCQRNGLANFACILNFHVFTKTRFITVKIIFLNKKYLFKLRKNYLFKLN